jgi:hypothetical protein
MCIKQKKPGIPLVCSMSGYIDPENYTVDVRRDW